MTSPHPADHQQIRAAVSSRYSGLARAAQAGATVTDCEDDAFGAGCFGPAGYPDISGLPDGAVRASLGCGNPVATAELRPGETVLDLGSGGGIDVLLSARRVSPGGKAYGLDMTEEMLQLARANARQRCASIAQTVGIPVPVPTAGNPSREWVAKFSLIERHRGEQAGCRLPPPRFVTQPPGH